MDNQSQKQPSFKMEFLKFFGLTFFTLTIVPIVSIALYGYINYVEDYSVEAEDLLIASIGMLIYSLLILLIIFIGGALAFAGRTVQYRSFRLSRWIIIPLTLFALMWQGGFVVKLSYDITVYFFNVYYPKLIAIIAIGVVIGIFYTLYRLFIRIPKYSPIEGSLVMRDKAPALWDHIDQIAAKMNTTSPDQIVAGIDDNFFVTESPVMVEETIYKGRTLYISIPLLRILTKPEADAILAHELNHLRGGDTKNSAKLGGSIHHFDQYLYEVSGELETALIAYPLNLYRSLFEIALQRESRSREFMADRAAAEVVSSEAIVTSLIKIMAYSSYRYQVEDQLFEEEEKHAEELNIADATIKGLNDYVSGDKFLKDMESSRVPHPFDSHPSLDARMDNVNYRVEPANYPSIVMNFNDDNNWLQFIPIAEDLEDKQWQSYEEEFSANHEESLAYRYLPENEEQKAVILKYFPPLTFQLGKKKQLQLNYDRLISPKEETFLWEEIKNYSYKEGTIFDTMTFRMNEKGRFGFGNQAVQMRLRGFKKGEKDQFLEAFEHYINRYAIAQSYHEERMAKK